MRIAMYDGFTDLVRTCGMEQAAAYAVEHGFSAVEFLGTVHPPVSDVAEAAYARRVLEAYGLSVACYSVGTTLYRSPDEEARLLCHADIAAALGSPYLHHTLYSALSLPDGAPDFDTVMEDVLPRACRVARHVASLGMVCLYEEQGMYFNGLDRFGRFFRRMQAETEHVGVCADLGNILFADESPEDFVRAHAADVRHVHIKDYRRSAEPKRSDDGRLLSFCSTGGVYLTETAVGTGDAHVAACLSILRESGYRGAYALEIGFSFPHPYEEIAAQDMAYLLNLCSD